MNIQNDGHLSLNVVDLCPEYKEKHPPEMQHFMPDVRVAAAYANRAGYPVTFIRPGFIVEAIKPDGMLLPVRKIKQFPKPKPVPKHAIGKCVDHFPAKKIFREVVVRRFDEYDDPDGAVVEEKRWVRAPAGTVIGEGDVWK